MDDPEDVRDFLPWDELIIGRRRVVLAARRSQLLALRWGDIDWQQAAISFTRGLGVGPKGLELRPTKTHRTYRVELDPETLAALRAHRALAEAEAREAGVDLADGAFVFSGRADGATPWVPNWTTKEFVAVRRAAGLAHFRLHDLRHFMATQMLAAGVPIVTVSQRLSHARVSTTLNVYAHSVPGGDRQAAETLAAILADGRRQSTLRAHGQAEACEKNPETCQSRKRLGPSHPLDR